MRYSLLSAAIVGAATVGAVPLDTRDYSDEGTCHVETVTLKMMSLDHFKGHTFDLLTPHQAIQGVAESLNRTLPDSSAAVGGTIPKPSLVSFNPSSPESTTAAGAAGSLASGTAGASSTGASGVVPPFPTGTGKSGSGSYATDIPGLPGYKGSGNPWEGIHSIIPEISSALGYLTQSGSGHKVTASSTASGAGASSTAPFPIPTGGSNSTLPSAGVSGAVSAVSSGTTAAAADSSSPAKSSGTTTSATSTTHSTTHSSTKTSASSTASGKCSSPKVRVEWRNMADSDKKAFSKGVKCLMDAPSQGQAGAKSRWDDLASLHQQQNDKIHGVGQFLPFHRYFIHVFETVLSQECKYSGPIPWWDETRDAGKFQDSPVFDSQYLGSAYEKKDNMAACLADGAFADVELNIGPGSNNQAHCISRAIDNDLSKVITNDFIATCNSHSNYADMLNCHFPGPHAYGHDAVGAVMADVMTSPGDPIFFLHHGMVDRAWKLWQSMDSANAGAMGGYTTQNGKTPCTTKYTLSSMGVLPDVPVSKVMDTEGDYLCYKYDY